MSAKVLVVDDSLTIQKVVSITLAKSGYSLTPAHDEDELFSELEKSVFDLILLDFNLSDSLSGYELAKKIKEKSGNTKLLAMIGTFDSVNDSEMSESGIDASIIKPFESSKFIETCEGLIGEVEESSDLSVSSEDVFSEEDDENDGWETSTTLADSDSEVDDEVIQDEPLTNSLKEEIEGWGMSLPDIIEASEVTRDMDGQNILMPPKIDKKETDVEFTIPDLDDDLSEVPEIGKEVSDDDLLFPETNDLSKSENTSSKLASLNELNLDLDDEVTLSIESLDEDDEDLIKEFENEEDDEFWATEDDSEDHGFEEEVGPKLEKIDHEEVGPKLEKLPSQSIDIEEIIERVKKDLAPMITKMIEDKMTAVMSETIERVAWEAIPDMAENLVRNEVKEISQKIQDKHSL